MKLKFFSYLFVFILLFSLGLHIAMAKEEDDKTKTTAAGTVSLPNPLGTDAASKSPQVLLGRVINSVLGIIGSLALVMFIYGGATWMLSGGNQEKVTKGKQILIWATLGLVIIFTAYALVRFVLTTVTS